MSAGSRFLALWLLLSIAPATRLEAVIRVSMQMGELFERSRRVAVGRVASVDETARVMQIALDRTIRGTPGDNRVAVTVPPGVEWPAVSSEGPAIVFFGARGAAVHVADGWLRTLSTSDAALEVSSNDGPTLDFPGRTEALVRLVADLEAGRKTIAYEVEHNVFKGEIRKLAGILPEPKALAAADVNGDGWEDVVVAGAERAQLFLNHEGNLTEATDALPGGRGNWTAVGDAAGDWRPDLLIGDTIWVNNGGALVPGARLEPLPEGKVIAAGILDADGDGRADALLATASGEVTIFRNPGVAGKEWARETRRLWSDGEPVVLGAFSKDWGDNGKPHLLAVRVAGPTRYPLDPAGGPPADQRRLAGASGAWAVYGGTLLDVDGNGLDDYYGAGPKIGAILNNRGFGTFLPNFVAKTPYGKEGLVWGDLTRKTVLGSADLKGDRLDDVLVATEDGQLFAIDNPDVEVYY